MLPHDVEERFPQSQGAWRFCHRCFERCFDGRPQKRVCAAGGGHESQGLTFVLPTTTVLFDDNQ